MYTSPVYPNKNVERSKIYFYAIFPIQDYDFFIANTREKSTIGIFRKRQYFQEDIKVNYPVRFYVKMPIISKF